MDAIRAAKALADVAADLVVDDDDLVGHVVALLRGCQDAIGVDAAGILVGVDGRDLEVLAASDHHAADLELHQAHALEGPCVEAHRTGSAVGACSAHDLTARWPRFGADMVEAGYLSVLASPLRWRDSTIGALGLFRRDDDGLDDDERTVAQAFADLATVLVVHSTQIDTDVVGQRITEALAGRILIEQAKGVLADQQGVDMAAAYRLLVDGSTNRAVTLSDHASHVLEQARRPGPGER